MSINYKNFLDIFNKTIEKNKDKYGDRELEWIMDSFNVNFSETNRNGKFVLTTLNERITMFFHNPNDSAYNDRQRHATDGLFIELYKKYYEC